MTTERHASVRPTWGNLFDLIFNIHSELQASMNAKYRSKVHRFGLAMILVGIAGACMAPSVAHAEILFQDNFDGSNLVDLNGTTPDITTGGAQWVASPNYKANGQFGGRGSGTLAFTPVSGNVYTLDVSFVSVGGDQTWGGFGFANGQSTLATDDARFTGESTAVVVGRAWGLVRGSASAANNATFLVGTGDSAPWENGLNLQDAPVDVRVVLDTTNPTWTTTMFARTGADPFVVIRSEANLVNTDITSVGVSSTNGSPLVSSFQLEVVPVPEPGPLLLLASGAGLLALYRRHMRRSRAAA